jgi:hypothetical protein
MTVEKERVGVCKDEEQWKSNTEYEEDTGRGQ